MNVFLTLAFLFFIGCTAGWLIELLFRRFKPSNKTRKWINPGFLCGPYLPLYGAGLCGLYGLALLEPFINVDNIVVRKLLLFAVMALCMTLIEYLTGLFFTKAMHVRLWDYSDNKFNIQGIICPRFSFFWALLGAIYYFLVHPFIISSVTWLAGHLAFSFVIGMFYGVFAIDVCYSFKVVAKIKKFAVDNEVLIKYERFKEHIRQQTDEAKEKYLFMFALRSKISLGEQLKKFLEKQRAEFAELRQKKN